MGKRSKVVFFLYPAYKSLVLPDLASIIIIIFLFFFFTNSFWLPSTSFSDVSIDLHPI